MNSNPTCFLLYASLQGLTLRVPVQQEQAGLAPVSRLLLLLLVLLLYPEVPAQASAHQ
jgi:hypothetical protein